MSDKQEYVMVPREASPEMIDAYLRANDAYWKRMDEMPPPPNKWRTGTPKDATAESYRAMLQAAPPAPAMHASAPTGMKCADCYMDKEACPTCYSAWWKARHPHSQQMPEGAPPAPAPISDEQLDELHGAMSDEQMTALARLRGGCSCHISPPCNACVEPLTEKEAISLGLLPDEPPPAPVAHSKSEYKRRVAMGDASILPPAPVPVQPAPVAAPVVTDAQISVPRELLQRVSESLGSFCSDHGWAQSDMDTMDSVDAILAAQSGAGTRGDGQ